MTVVLLSGGMDSTAALAHTIEEVKNPERVTALSVNYGQRHIRELEAARAVAGHYGIVHRVLELSGLLTASVLTEHDRDVPEGHYTEATMKQTVVPGRNLLFLAAAAAYAQANGHDRIVIAAHAGDHPVYPDCRPSFLEAARLAVAASSDGAVELVFPFVNAAKADIATHGHNLGAPFYLTWSCYKGGDIHCGRCGTCTERYEAFRLACVTDPTVYADEGFARETVGMR